METEPNASMSADATKTAEESTRKAADLAMPTLVPRRLFHQHGPVGVIRAPRSTPPTFPEKTNERPDRLTD